LKIAKPGVERAILLQRGCANKEEDEARAIHVYTGYASAWIDQQLESLGIDLKQQRQEV